MWTVERAALAGRWATRDQICPQKTLTYLSEKYQTNTSLVIVLFYFVLTLSIKMYYRYIWARLYMFRMRDKTQSPQCPIYTGSLFLVIFVSCKQQKNSSFNIKIASLFKWQYLENTLPVVFLLSLNKLYITLMTHYCW